jgi:hypothetical protein
MGEVQLARMWQLSDGTSCVLVKDSRADNWHLRITRADKTLRNETFGNPLVAMTMAKQWRETFGPVETSH